MTAIRTLSLLLVLSAGVAGAQMTQTLPDGFDVMMGGSGTSFPFNSTADHKWQWHYDSGEFAMQQPIMITDIAIRALSGTSAAFDFPSVTVIMADASTDYQAATHDMTFANNILTQQTVRMGPWSGPATMGFVPMGLTTPYTYDPSLGNDFIIQIEKCGTTSTFGTVDGSAAGAGMNGGNRYGNTTSCSAAMESFRNNEYVPIVRITYNPVGPMCTITAPAMGSMVSGSVIIDHDVDHAMGLPVDLTYEWSTDAGMNFFPATPGGMSVNPLLGVAVPSMQSFEWDTAADLIGAAMIQTATFRISVNDGMVIGTCAVDLDVDNVAPSPTCTLTLASTPPVGGNVDFDFLPDSMNAPTVDALFEYSIDSGATWNTATPATGANPALALPIAMLTTFSWDSRADMVGMMAIAPGVEFRATVSDGIALVDGTCMEMPFDVDNTALCQGICGDCDLNAIGPDILDALTAAQIAAGLITMVPQAQVGCCDVNASMSVDVLDALQIAQAAAGLPTMLMCL